MQRNDYLLTNVRIGKVSTGTNAGQFYITALARRLNKSTGRPSIGEKGLTEQFYTDSSNKEMIDAIRSLYPKTGKDSDGNDWNGTADIDPTTFDVYEAMKKLRDYREMDWLLLDGCVPMIMPFAYPKCMKYSMDMNGHTKGEWICGKDGFVKTYTSVTILVRYADDECLQPMAGWEPERRLQQKLRNYYSLSAVMKEKPELVDPIYKTADASVVPATSAEASAPEQANDERCEKLVL